MKHSFEGIFCPDYCPRGLKDCKPLAQIIATDHTSFYCVGENDGRNRTVEQDRYRVCFKNGDIDRQEDVDRRDLQHAVAVQSMALAAISEEDD